jgi:hypothetical protein
VERIRKVNNDERKNDNEEIEDLLPEYCHYKDTGCELAKSCLDCPFPDCIHDSYWGLEKRSKEIRNQEIFRLITIEKKTQSEIAELHKISLRSVRRILMQRRTKK